MIALGFYLAFSFSFVSHVSAAGTPCILWDSSKPVTASFGASFNLFSSANELLMNVLCFATSASMTVGNGSAIEYIYKTGYTWQNNQWTPFPYSGSTMDSGGNWFIGQASVTNNYTATQLAQKNSVLAYICEWTGVWKCGCNDSACTTNYWNLQQFTQSTDPTPPPPSIAGNAVYVAPDGSDLNPGTLSQPFLTIQRARDAIKLLLPSMSSDISVYIRGGLYPQTSALKFDSSDSGQNGHNVIYSSYAGDPSPVISGGILITGWTLVGDGIYKANVGGLRFRQFYVNGKRAVRARMPNVGSNYAINSWDTTNKLVVINAGEIENWSRLNEVEMVVMAQWLQRNLRIASFSSSGGNASITAMEPERSENFGADFGVFGNNSYFFENAFEFLDSPGEWYLNTGTNELFYKPRPSEDMNTALAVVPSLDTLVQIQGTLASPVHNLQFSGLTFEHSNWTLPSIEGLVMTQAIAIRCTSCSTSVIPPAILVQNAKHLRLERNIFRNMGASGLGLWSGTQDNVIIGNVFKDIAGTGIALDMNAGPNPADYRMVSQRDAVLNNYVTRVGQDYRGSVGIWAGFLDSGRIEHNELFNMPYSGINAGWKWSTLPTQAKNNTIRYNRIHNVMNQLADGSGIYTLGAQPGTSISENYVYDLARSPWAGSYAIAGLYTDAGSTVITLENNVLENVPSDIFDNSGASGNTFFNNGSNTTNSNSVKANAGILPVYQDILLNGN